MSQGEAEQNVRSALPLGAPRRLRTSTPIPLLNSRPFHIVARWVNAFHTSRRSDDISLPKRATNNLETDGHPVVCNPCTNRRGRLTCQVERVSIEHPGHK